MGKFKAEI